MFNGEMKSPNFVYLTLGLCIEKLNMIDTKSSDWRLSQYVEYARTKVSCRFGISR